MLKSGISWNSREHWNVSNFRNLPILGKEFVVAHLAVVGVQGADGIGGGVEHLFRHRDRIRELLEIEEREFFGRRHRDDLVVQIAEEVLDRLELALDELDALFELVERRDPPLEDLDVRLLDAARFLVGRALGRAEGLRKLVVDGLAVDRLEMLLAAPVDVEQIDEILPALFERGQVRRQFAGAGELLVVLLDPVLLPFQKLDSLALTRREALDQFLPVGAGERQVTVPLAAVDQLAVGRDHRQENDVDRLADQSDEERDDASGIGCGDGKAGQAPEIDWLLDRLLDVLRVEPLDFFLVFR